LRPFHEAEKPRSRWRVGTEAEKFGVYVTDGSPVPFEGERGIQSVLLELCDRHGWFAEREHEGGEVIMLRRGDATITLEPGAQLELSGAPLSTIHQTCAEFRGHMAELRDISDELGIGWLGLGFHPFARQADLPWVPKLRYGVMKQYLPTKGALALDMMRRTCTVQANFDFQDEADATRKTRVSLALSPIVTAMFANSPWVEGAPSGEVTHRGRVWLEVDPDRSGLLPFAWADDFSYRSYVEWALDVPMFLIKRGSQIVPNTDQTFRAFMRDGKSGLTATYDDWLTHLNTLFPEVRLKKTLEVRGADGQPTPMVCALPALAKGFLYDDGALAAAETLVSGLDHDGVEAARAGIAKDGLRATLAGREVGEWANELLAISEAGLERLGALNRRGEDERIHLSKLKALIQNGKTPADAMLDDIDAAAPLLPQVLEKARV
ncbi:MAG TPA: glutamate--cysteine ligase, partial [Myxococcales bacterium]|nr:glutamate--cysteine ligase [Myxococcales bacterium]